jgi:hypothetical protein
MREKCMSEATAASTMSAPRDSPCNEVDKTHRYCPLDIFSGDEQRILCALKGLCQDARNNLKVFVDGNRDDEVRDDGIK